MKKMMMIAAVLLSAVAGWCQADGVQSKALRQLLMQRAEYEKKTQADSTKPLGDFSEQRFAADHAVAALQLQQLRSIDTAGISFDDQITLRLLQFMLEDDVQEYELRRYLSPIVADGGFHMNLSFRVPRSFRTAADVERYLLLLTDVPRFVQEHFTLMRRGLQQGISQPAVVVKSFATSYTRHQVAKAEESVYYAPFAAARPTAIDSVSWQKYQQQAGQLVMQVVVPQYKAIQQFFEGEYIPTTKKSLGVIDYPNGERYYQQRVNYFTTTNIHYNEVFALGEQEVARIKAEMQQVLQEVKFKGSLQEFINMLRTDPRFYPKTPEELLKEASFIAKKIDGKLPQFFGKLPRLPYTVAPVPADLAPNYTGGRYSPGRGSRAGEYWVNTYNLPARPFYNLEALSLHEAVPGHHLQMALSLELENVPEFRRNLYVNAFGEGWALYCEYLGTEMGFYKDPYSRFGKLTYEMWRACRLVVDVGLHAKGWTRQQAVDYLASHTALSMHEVNTEIDRYIAWPGQALSYKMGELKIRELRAKAEQALGSRFDLRAFHDMLLSKGTVTLAIMEEMVDRFIAQQR